MMTSVSGKLGIGKTYHLAKELYENYKAGCLCISNFKHVYSHITVRNDPEILIEIIRQVGEFKRRGYELCDLLPSFRHGGIFIGIDEAHLTFGSDYSNKENMKFILQFLSLARKQDVNIWYVVQDPAKIHKNFRRYTTDWVKYRAVIPVFKNKFVVHPTRPTYRREKRLIFPWVWEELHDLDYENPIFNYQKTFTEEGFKEWSSRSTLIKRKIRRTKDPFVFKMYDSHEMVGMKLDTDKEEDFNLLTGLSYIPHTMRKDSLPTFKKILHLKSSEDTAPTRFKFRKIILPEVKSDIAEITVKQPEEFLDDISFFNTKKRKKNSISHSDKQVNTKGNKKKNKASKKLEKNHKKIQHKSLFDFLF